MSRDTVCGRQVLSCASDRGAHALTGPRSADGAVRPFHGDVLAYWGGSRCNALHLEQHTLAVSGEIFLPCVGGSVRYVVNLRVILGAVVGEVELAGRPEEP